MTLIEAQELLKNKYFSECKTPEDAQNVLGKYTLAMFGEGNAKKATSELQKIQTKLARKNPTPTPEVMNAMFSQFGAYVEKKKLAVNKDFNAVEFVIMTIVAAELEEELGAN